MPRALDQNKYDRWRDILQQWRSSGLTVRQFCLRNHVNEGQFWWWRRRLDGTSRTSRSRSAVPASKTIEPPSPKNTTFLPVTIVEPPASTGTAIDIHLRGGHRLRVRSGCDRGLLAEVVALLEGQTC